jgi:hypothetical protein
MVLASVSVVFLGICFFVYKLVNFYHNKKDAEQDAWFFLGPWSNDDDSEHVSAPLPPLLPASGDSVWRRAVDAGRDGEGAGQHGVAGTGNEYGNDTTGIRGDGANAGAPTR